MSSDDKTRLDNGKPTTSLNRLSNKYLGEKITINDLRKTAVDRVESETKFLSPRVKIQKFLDLGQGMGHSFTVQQNYYNVNPNGLEFKMGKLKLDGEYEYAQENGYLVIKLKQ